MTTWNTETAEWYAEKYGEYDTNRLGIEGLGLSESSAVVDVGCGTGSALRQISAVVTSGALIGVDPVPRMVEIATAKTQAHPASDRITYYEGSAENLPLAENIADFVLAFDSYDHWQNHSLGLQEVQRVLKPNGYFVVVKDADVPQSKKAKNAFILALQTAGFDVVNEAFLESESVRCTRWVCRVKG
jgi:ubiquinone/menaquinone biosynthesis C-methylase UbiE